MVTESAVTPQRLTLDPAGYFVVYPDQTHNRITLEHYTNKGVLDRVFTAAEPTALYASVIDARLISRLDHAAYLGRELARAEHALRTGDPYVQDRAPGNVQDTHPGKQDLGVSEKPTACSHTSIKGEPCD